MLPTKWKFYYIFGILLFIIGISLVVWWPDLFERILANELKFAPGTKPYEVWKKPPVELNMDFYMYNWTNSEEFRNTSVKPMVHQLGPYRFKERLEKVNITWNSHNSTITYRRLSRAYFDAKGSNGSLDDLITSLNPIALGASEKHRYSNFFQQKKLAISLVLFGSKTTVTKTVGELLYDGYEDALVTMSRTFPALAGETAPLDRVGWYYARNGSAEPNGWFNVNTGEKNMNNFGALQSWNFENKSSSYEGECAKFRGSGGEFFAPNQQRGRISMFVPDMCRDVPLDFEGEAVVHGIAGYKYSGGADSFNQENSCFPNDKIPPGLFNITACKFGMPAFISFPHFYQADPYYASLVDGMEPDKSKHKMYIVLEPKTGAILEVAVRIQLNLFTRSNPSLPLFDGIAEVFLPILWAEQRVTIPQNYALLLRLVLAMPIVGQVFGAVIAILGAFLVLWLTNRSHDKYVRPRQKENGESGSLLIKIPVNNNNPSTELNVDLKLCKLTTEKPLLHR